MTTQVELLEIANRHQAQPAVAALLTSLTECRTSASNELRYLASACEVRKAAIEGRPDFHVMLDNSDMVTSAAKASAALSRIAGDFMTLASVLSGLGENISY